MTPREVSWAFEGHVKRLEREQQDRIALAWQTGELVKVAFHAPKKFPKYEQIAGKRKRPAQSEEQMLAIAHVLVAKFGGEVRHRGK